MIIFYLLVEGIWDLGTIFSVTEILFYISMYHFELLHAVKFNLTIIKDKEE